MLIIILFKDELTASLTRYLRILSKSPNILEPFILGTSEHLSNIRNSVKYIIGSEYTKPEYFVQTNLTTWIVFIKLLIIH